MSTFLRTNIRIKMASLQLAGRTLSVTAILLGAIFSTARLCAQVQTVPAMRLTQSDNVSFLDRDVTNFQLFALLVDENVEPQATILPSQPTKTLIRHWREKTLPYLNTVGGTGDESIQQGYAVVATFYEAAALWQLTGDASYVDIMERALMGGLPATMMSSPDATERSVAAQAVMDASQMVYTTDTSGIFVNFFLNTMAHVCTPEGLDLLIDQATQMPFGPMMKLRLRDINGRNATFTLRLRLPEWGTPHPDIFINGHETDYEVERGYAVIRRTWRPYDELYMVFDILPKAIVKGDSTMFRCGPVVYCPQDSIPSDTQLRLLEGGEDELSHHPLYTLQYTQGSDTLRTSLRPYFETPPLNRHIWMRKVHFEDGESQQEQSRSLDAAYLLEKT